MDLSDVLWGIVLGILVSLSFARRIELRIETPIADDAGYQYPYPVEMDILLGSTRSDTFCEDIPVNSFAPRRH